jgi:exopolysaccharide/PEP-CTERM locus tyrosine autokinase
MSTKEKHSANTHNKTTEIRPLALENLPSVVTPKQQIRQMSEINQLSYKELEAAKIIYPGMADVATLNTFRELRTKLMQKTDKNNFILMVSSLALNGGGSYISRNLAAAISLDFEKTALLVDCDLNRPSCDKLLSTPVDFGLTDYLEEPSLSVSDIIYATGIPRLRITPAGNQRANGSEFFTSDRMEEYIQEVKTRYSERFIIVDAPPINSSPDARVLADLCDYTILVVPYGKVTRVQISAGIDSIPEGKFAGLVFNN